jgi:hypothetical protein
MVESTTEVQAYEKPTVVDHGDLRELTEGGIKANHLDGTYAPTHTTTFIFSAGS